MALPFKWLPHYRSLAIIALVVVLVVIQWRDRSPNSLDQPQQLLQGSTMGTTYTIHYRPEIGSPVLSEMQQFVSDELLRVNQQMSTYLKDSEISRFNASSSTDWFDVSVETASVVDLSLHISSLSHGAFDVTVGPLVNLWGFGADKSRKTIPSESEIEAARASVGYRNLAVQFEPPALKKSNAALQVDLSAIAKGHGVDRVAGLFRKHGISNYFIEIGGEVFAQGYRLDGRPWQVGIEAPLENKQSIHSIIGLSGAAMATSGDYRNFFEADGQRFSHTIDPNTGRPVTHSLASASVVCDSCALADAIATCMMVLGFERGSQLAETENWAVLLMQRPVLAETENWAVLLMQRNENQISSTCSKAFSDSFPSVCKQLTVAK